MTKGEKFSLLVINKYGITAIKDDLTFVSKENDKLRFKVGKNVYFHNMDLNAVILPADHNLETDFQHNKGLLFASNGMFNLYAKDNFEQANNMLYERMTEEQLARTFLSFEMSLT